MMWPRGMKEEAAAREFVHAVRFAQHMALTRQFTAGSPWGLELSGSAYSIRRKGLSIFAVDPSGSGEYKNRELPGGYAPACSRSVIWFDRFGRPLDSGGAPLGSAITCVVGTRSITIYPETGYVEGS